MENSLKKLILQLSKREKEYFLKYKNLNKYSSPLCFLEIYDYIDNKGNINTEELMKVLGKKNFNKKLSSGKEKLLDKILLSLVNYNFESTYSWAIQKDILMIRVLIEKGLIEKAHKKINQSKKYAYKYEEFELLLNIIILEESLCFKHCYIQNYTKFIELQEERKKVIDLLNNMNSLLTLKAELQNFQLKENYYSSDIKSFINEYMKNPLYSDSNIKSKKAQSLCYYIKMFFFFIQHDYNGGFLNMQKYYEFYHSCPEFFSLEEYLQLLNNFLYYSCLMNDEKTFNKLMNEFKEIKNYSKEFEVYINNVVFYRTLQLYHRLQKFKEAEIIAIEAELFIEKNKHIIETIDINYLQLLIIIAYIDNKNFDAANRYANKRYRTRVYESNSSLVKLFEFLIQYKLGNLEGLVYSVNSWAKIVGKKRKQNPIERCLFKFFRTICNVGDNNEKKELIRKVISQLNEIKKIDEKYYINHFFDFADWFENELKEIEVPQTQ